MTDRALFIGIDGFDMNMLGRLDAGDIPNITKMVHGGARARLRSVTPLNSAAAWTSLITGKFPAGHGIFGFTRGHPDLYHRSTARCDDIGAPTIWEIANSHGAPMGIINCPMTWPPPSLDGFVISGIPIPYNQLFARPRELEAKLRDRFGPYIVDLPWGNLADGVPGVREAFLAGMYQMARKREEVALWTMRNLPWRIFMVVFTGTDRLLHSFWHLDDPNHPSYNATGAAAYGRDIKRYFILLDEIIGRILNEAGPDMPVILASDHGFGPLHLRFHLRRWLENRRYLVSLPDGTSARGDDELDPALRGIDWDNTVAYPASLSESGIWINKAGRQPRGVVGERDYETLRKRIADELAGAITNWRQPIDRVYRREEALSGPYLAEAPDLLIEAHETYIVDDGPSEVEISPSLHETATHRTMGMFAASGPVFRREADLGVLNIVDVLPTLLATAGVPVPDNLDGKPALEAYESPPNVIRSNINPPPRARRELTEGGDEDKAMKEQLKGLGYL